MQIQLIIPKCRLNKHYKSDDHSGKVLAENKLGLVRAPFTTYGHTVQYMVTICKKCFCWHSSITAGTHRIISRLLCKIKLNGK